MGLSRDDTSALLTGLELRAEIVVLADETTQLNDYLVQEVVHLRLVVTATELGSGEVLVEDILGREGHVVTSVDPVRGRTNVSGPGGKSAGRGSRSEGSRPRPELLSQ